MIGGAARMANAGFVCATAGPVADVADGATASIDAKVISDAAAVTAALLDITALAIQAVLLRAAAPVAADQRILAAGVPDARCAARAARFGAGARCGAAHLAVNTALVTRAAVSVAGAPGRAASAIQALLCGGAACAATEWSRAGAAAKDADQVAGTPATVAVDAAAIRATGAAIAIRHAPGWWFRGGLLRFLLLFLLAFGRDVDTGGRPQAKAERCGETDDDPAPGAYVAQRSCQPVELPVVHDEASRPSIPLARGSSRWIGEQSCQIDGRTAPRTGDCLENTRFCVNAEPRHPLS